MVLSPSASNAVNPSARPLEQSSGSQPAAAAHRDQGVPAAHSLQLVHRLGHEDRTGRAQGVTERDGPAIGIDAAQVGIDLVRP